MRALLPLALGVATGLLAACSNGGAPTSPDPAQAPSFAQRQSWYHDDPNGTCKYEHGWAQGSAAMAPEVDRNGNGYICYKYR